jgi:hypothetical protein
MIARFIICAALAIATPMLAHAEVYKCVDKGRVVYSDSQCAYDAKPMKIDPKANSYTGGGIGSSRPNHQAGSSSQKCSQLLEEMNNTVPDPSRQSFGQIAATKSKRNALRESYEIQCMSPGEQSAASQRRTERSLGNIEGQQRQLNIRQQEIQNKQRQMENNRRTQKLLDGY